MTVVGPRAPIITVALDRPRSTSAILRFTVPR
jgi:hypothetical protein